MLNTLGELFPLGSMQIECAQFFLYLAVKTNVRPWSMSDIRDIRKVRKRQHLYPELVIHKVEIQKRPEKSTLAFNGAGKSETIKENQS
jgi:hypothetical protein